MANATQKEKGRKTVACVSSASFHPPSSPMVKPKPKEEVLGHGAWKMHFFVILPM